jgi:hypothetical protein
VLQSTSELLLWDFGSNELSSSIERNEMFPAMGIMGESPNSVSAEKV